MWESETKSVREREFGNGFFSSTKHGFNTDGFQVKGQSWYISEVSCLFPEKKKREKLPEKLAFLKYFDFFMQVCCH